MRQNAKRFSFNRSYRMLKEAIEGRATLYVFDFDMTLAIPMASVRRKTTGDVVSQDEFDIDSKKPGGYNPDDYDFSEFRKNLKFQPIQQLVELFSQLLEKGENVVILTARSSELGPMVFLSAEIPEHINLDNLEMVTINKPNLSTFQWHDCW